MKSQFIVSVFLVAAIVALAISCKKNNTTPIGGKGGNATLVVTPIHANLNVDSCTVYIKYNAADAPANNVYDDSQKCYLVDTIPVAIFPKLKQGQYYIYGYGYHTYYNIYVHGGIPILINKDDTTPVLLPTAP